VILLDKNILKQFSGEVDTFCKRCKKKRSIKIMEDSSFTIKCKCGCDVHRYYEKDEFHDKPFYTRNFISHKEFNEIIHKREEFEKLGFKKDKSGKWVK